MLWPTLAAIRLFLALIVAGSHLSFVLPPSESMPLLRHLSGLSAVLGFLVISGYSIAHSYERSPHQFYQRRALRILPLYVPIVLASEAVPLLLGPITVLSGTVIDHGTIAQIIGNLLFLQGFVVLPLVTNAAVWTLSIEVALYLLVPWGARLSGRVLLALVIASALFFVLPSQNYYSENLGGLNVLLLGWAWVLGFWLYRQQGNKDAAIFALSFGVVAMAVNGDHFAPLWPIPWIVVVLGIAYGAAIPYRKRVAKFLSWCGDVSYPLYLCHLPVYFVLYRLGAWRSGWVFLACAIALAAVLVMVPQPRNKKPRISPGLP